MKIVINADFGGFEISEECEQLLGLEPYEYDEEDLRTDARLIALVEKDADWTSGECATLKVVEIPDEVTDWEISEYDGSESIIAVINGKLRHIW